MNVDSMRHIDRGWPATSAARMAANRRSTRASAIKTAPTPLLKPEFMVDGGGVSIEAKSLSHCVN